MSGAAAAPPGSGVPQPRAEGPARPECSVGTLTSRPTAGRPGGILWRWRLALAVAAAWVASLGLYFLVFFAVFSGRRAIGVEAMASLTLAAEAASCGVALLVWGAYVCVAMTALRLGPRATFASCAGALAALAALWLARSHLVGLVRLSGLGGPGFVALELAARFAVPAAYCAALTFALGRARPPEGSG